MIKVRKPQKPQNESSQGKETVPVRSSLKENLTYIETLIRHCPDFIITPLELHQGTTAVIAFLSEMADKELIQRDIVAPLLGYKGYEIESFIRKNQMPVSRTLLLDNMDKVIDEVFNGNTVVMVDGVSFAAAYTTAKIKGRNIKEPETEKITKGSHEGFIESLDTNMSLLRKKIRSTTLKFRLFTIGKRANQRVAMAYIEDIANPQIVNEMEKRLKSIDYDLLSGAGYIEQMTADSRFSPVPQYHTTERPDKAAANLMEGRLVILLDNTPVVLMMPANFFEYFQSVDDYTANWVFGSFLRVLRFLAIMIAVTFPAFYIAVLTFHYQSVPLNLLIPLAESRARVPFPPIIEALLMELTFELIREASIRLPSNLGPTVGIVGGLVIGQTAIEAGIVSNIMVIIVAITAIATFVVPTFDMGLLLRLSRFGAMLLAASFGIVGLMIFLMFAFAHLVTLESLGQPYFKPVIPLSRAGLLDTFIRAPYALLRKRPDFTSPQDKTKGGTKGGK